MGKGLQRAAAATALTRIDEAYSRVLEAIPPNGVGETTRGGIGTSLVLGEADVRRAVDVLLRNDLVQAPSRGVLARTDIGNAAVEILASRRGASAGAVVPSVENDAASPRR